LRGIGPSGVNAMAWRFENAGQLEGDRGIGRPADNFFVFLLAQIIFRAIFNQMVKYSPRLLNRTFAALADPTRRRILAHLARGDRCVTDLARPHAMSLPAVSKHLRVLEKAGLLRRRRYGRVHEMQLDAKPLQQAARWVEEYRKFWEGSLDRLAEYLEKANRQSKKKKMT